jgi:hypothetical protein
MRPIVNQNSRVINKLLVKWGEIPIDERYLKGVIKIKKYRNYQYAEEVDIIFDGKIYVMMGSGEGWYDSSILNDRKYSVSIVKLNRFFKKTCLFEVKTRMKYFGVDISYYKDIKKFKWE